MYIFSLICVLFIAGAGAHPYLNAAITRALSPYRPKTCKTYRRQFQLFLAFAMRMGAKTVLSVSTLISFLEFLISCNTSTRVINNYVSGIKGYLNMYGLPTAWMAHQLFTNYMRAVQIQIPHVKKVKSVITLYDMYSISKLLQQFDHSLQYRVAFMLSFYAFLRISNIVPSTLSSFDPSRQLCYEDVTFTPQGVTLYLKWAKNLQKTEQSHVVMIPK